MASKPNILFVSHDANRAGAQLFLLNIMKDFKAAGYGVQLLFLLKWGPLLSEFEEVCEVKESPKQSKKKSKILSKLIKTDSKKDFKEFIKEGYSSEKIDFIYANTIATACSATQIKEVLQVPLISHIHELQFSLDLYAGKSEKENLLKSSDGIIACSQAVKDNLVEGDSRLAAKTTVIHSFVDNESVLKLFKNAVPKSIKEEFKLPQDAFLAGACGNAEWRKGLDIFISLVNAIKQKNPSKKIHFVWIGLKPEGKYYEQIMYDVRKMGIADYVTFISPTPKAVEIINALDVFVVSSREDPFPLVMLEAALCQKPILGFKNTGGCSEFVKDEAGILAEYLDVDGMAKNLLYLSDHKDIGETKGKNGHNSILKNYSFEHSVEKLKTYLANF
ncbi:glycosyltransferase family 4 protein [uncultured Arcticibacterium sp.]|uniref:glycosyltransferase family 4 protein n=1 Tax=uncultured Arcticibacterium sp. TaxID=2173042 RepID=UPI0030FCF04B